MLTLTLPWPHMKPLSPNWRGHWGSKAQAKKSFRKAWAITAMSQGARKIDAAGLKVSLAFHLPNKRAMDLDNLLARCKAGLDGLADVLGVDDSKWQIAISKADTIGGFVRVTVEEV